MFYYGDAGIPKSYANSKWGHFAPRVGLVFNPHGDGRDTLRIGGGILYDVNEMYYGQRLTSNPPFSNDVSQTSPTAHLANPWLGYPGGNPFPGLYQTPNASTVFPVGGLYIVLNPNMKPTYMAQWNVTYQRQLPGNWMFSASYLASKTTHVWLQQDINPAVYIPGTCSGKACSTTTNSNQRRVLYLAYPSQGQYIAQMITADTGGNSFYQGALTSIQHRFSHNFSTLVNYTWSHCIDDEDFVGDMHNSQYKNPYNRRAERGDCNFDFGVSAAEPQRSYVVDFLLRGRQQGADLRPCLLPDRHAFVHPFFLRGKRLQGVKRIGVNSRDLNPLVDCQTYQFVQAIDGGVYIHPRTEGDGRNERQPDG